jgi:hypothetical protein
MWRVFLILYVSYLVLGPHWIANSVQGKKLAIVDTLREFLRRSVFISYVALLYVAWFLWKPTRSSFINALILSGAATLGFYLKYGREVVPMHILLNLFVLYRGRGYMDLQTWLTLVLLVFYAATRDILYLP